MSSPNGRIDKLDFPPADERRPLLHPNDAGQLSPGGSDTSRSGSFFEHVVEGIQERDRAKMKSEIVRYGAFACAILSWYVLTHGTMYTLSYKGCAASAAAQ
jgi:hypothetical protein